MPTKAEHPSDEVLEQYSLGQLPEPPSISLEEHLFTCRGCQDRLQEVDEYIAAMRTALPQLETETQPVEEKETAAFARFFHLPKPAWAGALAAIALVALVMPWRRGPQEPFELSLKTHRGVAVSQLPSAPADRPLRLNLNLTGLPDQQTFAAAVANTTGEILWQGAVERAGEAGLLNLTEPLDAGQYWVRIYDPSTPADLLREFSLRVQ